MLMYKTSPSDMLSQYPGRGHGYTDPHNGGRNIYTSLIDGIDESCIVSMEDPISAEVVVIVRTTLWKT
jgi:hypothetical protein